MPMDTLPDYIERRIRRSIPPDSGVVPGSTPVVSFGNSRTAVFATLGINPSRAEFLAKNGDLLIGEYRRLSTHNSLGIDSLADAPVSLVTQVLRDCDNYFAINPYSRWFNQLEGVLNECGASYYNGTACHLDLVQWATDPTWGRLDPKSIKKHLLDADAAFLADQLSRENISVLLVNGSAVISQLERSLGVTFIEQAPITGYRLHDTRLFTGTISGKITVIAWSTNLQSSFGVSHDLRSELSVQVAALAETHAFA